MTVRRQLRAKLMPLTQNQYAIVDNKMYEYLNQWKWYAQYKVFYGYSAYRHHNVGGGIVVLNMAHMVLPPKKGYVVHHINHNGLDNRKSNLQLVTPGENLQAQIRRTVKHSSKYKGVSKSYYRKKSKQQTWQASICINGDKKIIGTYTDEEEAAKAYDRKALEYFGEHARINFPENSLLRVDN